MSTSLQALPTGFRHDLVVRSSQAAADPKLERIEFELLLDGAEAEVNEAGGISILDTATGEETVATATPVMWDSSDIAEAPSAAEAMSLMELQESSSDDDREPRTALVAAEVDGDTLGLRPDLDLLRDPATVFPVVIDPMWTGNKRDGEWATVSNRYATTSYWKRSHLSNPSADGDAGVGQYCDTSNSSTATCTSSKHRMRSFFRMNTATVTRYDYKIPHRATFKILQRHSAVCTNGTAQVERTGNPSSSTTWNNQPSWSSQKTTISSAKKGRRCSGSDYVSFNVFDMVKSAEAGSWYSITIGMRASNESPSPDLAQWNRYDSGTAQLDIYYYIRPPQPDQLKVNGVSCTSSLSSAKWTNSRYPGLSARVKTLGENVHVRFRTRKSGESSNFYWWKTGAPVAAGTRSHNVTKSHPDGNYYWQAWAESKDTESVNSGYTSACYFKIDATKPSTPTVTASQTGEILEGSSVTMTLSSTDPQVNGVRSGLKQYEYSWNTNTYSSTKAATGSTTISRSNLAAGRHVLYVRARDNAGNASDPRTYTFFVGRDIPATPMGMWRFEGDLLDDTGHGHHLDVPVGDGAGFGNDRDNRSNASLKLDGDSCVGTKEQVIRTDAAYSVTSWVRLDPDARNEHLMVATQAGNQRGGFYLRYEHTTGKWIFMLSNQDAVDVSWASLRSTQDAVFGEWTHLAATVDPDAEMMRLYVNGQLTGERNIPFTAWDARGGFYVGCGARLNNDERWYRFPGSIDQVGAWQGLLSLAEVKAAAKDLPGAAEQARWTFRDGGTDEREGGDRHLDIPDHVVVGADAFSRPSGSVELDSQTCLEYPEPVVDTDRSFTVAAWVRFDETGRQESVAAMSGDGNMGFQLRKLSDDKFQFRLVSADVLDESGIDVWQRQTAWAAAADQWYHVAGVVDAAASEMRLYVNGNLEGARSIPGALWRASGKTLVGCSGRESDGVRRTYLKGSLHDVRLWRGPVDADQIQTMLGNPPADLAGYWALDSDGVDWSRYQRDLALVDNYSWTEGWDGWWDGALALEFDGGGYARTAGPVLVTDESYTVSAWVKLEDTGTDQVVLAQGGPQSSAFYLKYRAPLGQWEMAVPSDTGASSWKVARSNGPAALEEWIFLVGVFDLAEGEVRLYVDGELQQTATDAVGFRAEGPLTVGVAQNSSDGETWYPVTGAIDDVIVWQGALPESVIAGMYDPELVVNP